MDICACRYRKEMIQDNESYDRKDASQLVTI